MPKAFADHPTMAAAGGPVRPFWEQPPPQWLIEYIGDSKCFVILSFMEPYDNFQLNEKGYFFSCNMAIWKNVLKARGGFDPEATATAWIGDGESGLNKRMWANREQIGYVPEAVVYHHIPAHRMTVEVFLPPHGERRSVRYVHLLSSQPFPLGCRSLSMRS